MFKFYCGIYRLNNLILLILISNMFGYSYIYNKEVNAKHDKNFVPIAIIGSGPAGMTAGMYGSRSGYHTVVFKGDLPGGQLVNAAWVENWPGLKKASGKIAMEKLTDQAKSFGTVICDQEIKSIDFSKYPYVLNTSNDKQIRAGSVIIASGANPRKLGVTGEKKYWGHGIQHCALCDAPLYKNKVVAIAGGGDASIEQVLLLEPYAKKIYFLVRGKSIRASQHMQDKLKKIPNLKIIYNVQIVSFEGDNKNLKKVLIKNKIRNSVSSIAIDGAFISIGQEANSQFLDNQLPLTDQACVKVDCKQETVVPGVFAAGNIVDSIYRQANVACAQGCKAALNAQKFLVRKNIDCNKFKDEFYLYGERKKNIKNSKIKTESKGDHSMKNSVSSLEQLDKAIKNSKNSLLIFLFSPSCPHCHQMMPIIDEIASNNSNLEVVEVDLSQESAHAIAEKYNVSGVPHFILYKDSKLVNETAGSMSKEKFESFVNS